MRLHTVSFLNDRRYEKALQRSHEMSYAPTRARRGILAEIRALIPKYFYDGEDPSRWLQLLRMVPLHLAA